MKLAIPMSEPERIWLQELYRRVRARESVDPWQMRIELRDKLPNDFRPSQVSSKLAQGSSITLLGVLAIDPESEMIRDTERVIVAIRDSLIENPQARTVSAAQIAERLEIDQAYTQELFGLMSTVGRFWSSAQGVSSRPGYSSITVEEDNLEEFLSFENLEARIRDLLEERKPLPVRSLEFSDEGRRYEVLNPWRVIRSFLSRLRSYDVPDIIDRAGLAVDWSLTEKQDYSHATRWTAYRPRIDAAYESLSSDDDRLRVAFFVARELADRGLAQELNEALREIGWELRGNRLLPVGSSVRELFFPEQSQHDAYVQIRTLLQKATKSITIVDPYMDQSTLTLLSACAKDGMSVRLLTAKVPSDFVLEAQKWASQRPAVALEVRTAKGFHDRFVLLDGTECWHIGCSIKDAGNKVFMLSQVEDEENRAALVNQLEKEWASALVLT